VVGAKTRDHVHFAALAFRYEADGRLQVMLVNSRETRRWVIPKGWPVHGRKPREVALCEAFEDAGLVGRIVGKRRLGRYHYAHVGRLRVDWPKRAERATAWFEPAEACEMVEEGGLVEILRGMTRSLQCIPPTPSPSTTRPPTAALAGPGSMS
jgi:hypothetical protein